MNISDAFLAAYARVEELKNDNSFIKSPWRRKVKILDKESNRIFNKFDSCGLYGFNYLNKTKQYDKMESNAKNRQLIYNVFFEIIGITFALTNSAPSIILNTDIKNKEGRFLSYISKKKGINLAAESIPKVGSKNLYTQKPRNITYKLLPISLFAIFNFRKFWKDFDYQEFLKQKNYEK